MEVSHGEGIASHTGPESCEAAREGGVEALTGERAGRVFSRESNALRGADAVRRSGRQHRSCRRRETRSDLARSETPCTYGSTSFRNWEILGLPAVDGTAGRVGKSKDVRR
jgi:hypothetical protein